MIKESHIGSKLSEYNRIMKENDEVYRDLAKTLGLSESFFWILYALRAEDAAVQSELCACMHQPKQTVNSALKKMEADGYIELTCGGNRRSKRIILTEKGDALCKRTVDKVIAIESAALNEMPEEELELFLSLFRKYTALLKERRAGLQQNYK